MVYQGNMREALHRAAIILNVDLKINVYVLQAYVDFSLIIHFISNKK